MSKDALDINWVDVYDPGRGMTLHDRGELGQVFVRAVRQAREEGMAEGERRGRVAEAAEHDHTGSTLQCAVDWWMEGQSFESWIRHAEARHEGKASPCGTSLLAALQWFHDEVSAVLARGLNLRPILELRTDPRYDPIRAARKEGA